MPFSIVLRVILRLASLAKPRANQLSWAGWPPSSREPSVPAPWETEHATMPTTWNSNPGHVRARQVLQAQLSHMKSVATS